MNKKLKKPENIFEFVLSDYDKELSEIVLFKHEKILCFNEKNMQEKIEFLENIVDRLYYWMHDFLDNEKFSGCVSVDYNNPYTLGNGMFWFYNSLLIHRRKKHKVEIGWCREHGRYYRHYENDGSGKIFVSINSEGHPKKELRQEWFFVDNNDKNHLNIHTLTITHKKITDIKTKISEISIKHN